MPKYERSINRLLQVTSGHAGRTEPGLTIPKIASGLSMGEVDLARHLYAADSVLNRGVEGWLGSVVTADSYWGLAVDAANIIEKRLSQYVDGVTGIPLDAVSDVIIAQPLAAAEVRLIEQQGLADPQLSARNIGGYFLRVLSE